MATAAEEIQESNEAEVDEIFEDAKKLGCESSLKNFVQKDDEKMGTQLRTLDTRLNAQIERMDDANDGMETYKQTIDDLTSTINELVEQKEDAEKEYMKCKKTKANAQKLIDKIQSILNLFRRARQKKESIKYAAMGYPEIRKDMGIVTEEDIFKIGENDSYDHLRKLKKQRIELNPHHDKTLPKIKIGKRRGWMLENRQKFIADLLKITLTPAECVDADLEEAKVDEILGLDDGDEPPRKRSKKDQGLLPANTT